MGRQVRAYAGSSGLDSCRRVKAKRAARQVVRETARPRAIAVEDAGGRRDKVDEAGVAALLSTATRQIPSSPTRTPVTDEATQPQPIAGPSRLRATASAPMPLPRHRPLPSIRSTHIISSLFTSNPDAPAVQNSGEAIVGEPSNAPLSDTSTFEGLGLDDILVRHLKGKMKLDRPTGVQRSALPYLLSHPLQADAATNPPDPDVLPRDAFIQSQTGSGKTLAYLLPIIQTLLPLSRLSYIDRSIGTLAIILAPTRELAQQISKVLESILSLSLAGDDRLTRWLVSGLLTGGSTKTHEKARLRKGVPILVATPGRLLDHLQNTSSFQCAKTMFLVLDEADRVMDLGFEETIQGIIKALDGRRKNEISAEKDMDEEGGGQIRWPYWSRGRQAILCSATVDPRVERLAGTALRNPISFQDTSTPPTTGDRNANATSSKAGEGINEPNEQLDRFTPPSQLVQKYVTVPIKLRLVTLIALLRSLTSVGSGSKVIVFLSSTDAVDFHWQLLGGVRMGFDSDQVPSTALSSEVLLRSAILPKTLIHRLHGSLPLRVRQASLAAFTGNSSTPAILFATSVASRGLDLPLVRAVVQYDLPTESGAAEYVHRIGRTARAGHGGEAWAFVSPSEVDWIPWVEGKMGAASKATVKIAASPVETVLKKGFGGGGHEYETRATEVQLALEGWVLGSSTVSRSTIPSTSLVDEKNSSIARKAFSSYVRAYSTHPADEKRFFHIKSLHLGHLAKSFALREAPGGSSATPSTQSAKSNMKRKRPDKEEADDGNEQNDAERRMYEAVRKSGRTSKSGGRLGEYGGGDGEFQVVQSRDLERMVGHRR